MTLLSDKEIYARCTPPILFYKQEHSVFGSNYWNARTGLDGQVYDDNGNLLLASQNNFIGDPVAESQPFSGSPKFVQMITPFVDHLVNVETNEMSLLTEQKKVVSYGLSSFGYDLRIGNKFKIFTNVSSTVIDPKNFNRDVFIEHEGDTCIIPPNSFVLASSVERICMPKDVSALVLGKSTYARVGINCLATPLEAGWEGFVTLEFSNNTPLPVKMYANEGACQVLFFKGRVPCHVSYADRNGKYQNQPDEPVLPKV